MSVEHNENRNSVNMIQLPQQLNTNYQNTDQSRNEPRINILRNVVRRTCSFCRQPNHTISFCNDQRLHDFKILCENKKETLEITQVPHTKRAFKEWIIEYSLENHNIVKAFAVRNCGSTTRTNIQGCIDLIVDYFYDEYYGIPDLISDEDFIPFPDILEEQITPIQELVYITRMYRDFGLFLVDEIGGILDNQRPFSIVSQVIEENNTSCDCECVCDCDICYETYDKTKFVKLNCQHDFCKDCIKGILNSCNSIEGPKCAFCRDKITSMTFNNQTVKSEFDDLIQKPTI